MCTRPSAARSFLPQSAPVYGHEYRHVYGHVGRHAYIALVAVSFPGPHLCRHVLRRVARVAVCVSHVYVLFTLGAYGGAVYTGKVQWYTARYCVSCVTFCFLSASQCMPFKSNNSAAYAGIRCCGLTRHCR